MSSAWVRSTGMHKDSTVEQVKSREALVGVIDKMPAPTSRQIWYARFRPWWRWAERLYYKARYRWIKWTSKPPPARPPPLPSAAGERTLTVGRQVHSMLDIDDGEAFGPSFYRETSEYPKKSKEVQSEKVPHKSDRAKDVL
jgi:hypothetical protein